MRLKLLVVMLLCIAGCQRGDIQVSPIIEGQPAMHSGYNVGPELWLLKGDSAKVTGAVIWIKGLDPNDLF